MEAAASEIKDIEDVEHAVGEIPNMKMQLIKMQTTIDAKDGLPIKRISSSGKEAQHEHNIKQLEQTVTMMKAPSRGDFSKNVVGWKKDGLWQV